MGMLAHLAAIEAMTGALVVLGGVVALLHVCERRVSRRIAHRLGWRAVLITGWIGVPLHELSHLVCARLFGHRIIDFRLLEPDPASGTLGYVRQGYRRRSPLQPLKDIVIALAPLAAGSAALALIVWWTTSVDVFMHVHDAVRAELGAAPKSAFVAAREASSALARGLVGLGAAVWNERTPWLPLQLYLVAAVTAHMAPSRTDLHRRGPWLALGVLLAGAALAVGSPAVSPFVFVLVALLVGAGLVAVAFQLLLSLAVALLPR